MHKPVVLVVDDEAMIRLSTTSLVEDLEFGVLEAENAEDAMTLLESHPEVGILFTDINMLGKMDGLELAALAHRRWPPLRFIIVSGERTARVDEMPPGAKFFAKPYSLTAIADTLETFRSEADAAAAIHIYTASQ